MTVADHRRQQPGSRRVPVRRLLRRHALLHGGRVENSFSPDSYVWRGQRWAEVGMPAKSTRTRCRQLAAFPLRPASASVPPRMAMRASRSVGTAGRGRSHALAQPSMPYFALGGVSCVSSSRCTAAGSSFATTTTKSDLVESWNGKSWTVVPTPNPTGAFGGLAAVSCASAMSCLAVGPLDDQESISASSSDGTEQPGASSPWGRSSKAT